MTRIDFSDPQYSLYRRRSSFVQWLMEKGESEEKAKKKALGYFRKEIAEERQRTMDVSFLNKVRADVDKDDFYEKK